MKLSTVEQVQERVGKLPAPRDLKVIDYLDEHAARYLSLAQVGFLVFGESGRIQLTAAGAEPGFAGPDGEQTLQIPLTALDDSAAAEPGLSFGGLFLVSGMEETLRVNGRVSSVADGLLTVAVEECYLHCAKAFRRSSFWLPESVQASPSEIPGFVAQSRFLALATINREGQADVSPKGDPENFLIQEGEGAVCFADRPGNRRIDSFRNIIDQPEIAILALVPGCTDLLEIKGRAELCADAELLRRFAIEGKEPKLITRIASPTLRLVLSPAMARAGLWPAQEVPGDIVPSEIFKAHIKKSKESSLKAKIARAAVSLPGAMEKGLESDYKNNLY